MSLKLSHRNFCWCDCACPSFFSVHTVFSQSGQPPRTRVSSVSRSSSTASRQSFLPLFTCLRFLVSISGHYLELWLKRHSFQQSTDILSMFRHLCFCVHSNWSTFTACSHQLHQCSFVISLFFALVFNRLYDFITFSNHKTNLNHVRPFFPRWIPISVGLI